jgi:hypothetical protein
MTMADRPLEEPLYTWQPSNYDAYADAIARRIEVGFIDMESPAVIWVPDSRAIVIGGEMSERRRHEALAHALTHVEHESTRLVRRARAGEIPRAVAEAAIHKETARTLVSMTSLRRALRSSAVAVDVAAQLGVAVSTLVWRLRHLRCYETRLIGVELIDRLTWHTDALGDRMRCVWPSDQSRVRIG